MSSKYYSEFDFYRKLLRIIHSNKIDICKLRSIECAINDQFRNFNRLIRSHRVTFCNEGEVICYED